MAKALENHPYADLFPMMSDLEMNALVADIKENGQRHPIILYKGLILDGRNRYLACQKAKVEPTFTTLELDSDKAAYKWVVSLNVQKRDLTASQRAIVAARALPIYEEEAKERQKEHGKTAPGKGKNTSGKNAGSNGDARDEASEIYKVAARYISDAKSLLEEASDLVQEVEAGRLSIGNAMENLKERRKEKAQRAKDAQKISAYAAAVESEEMTFEEAVAKAIQDEREQKEKEASQEDSRKHWLTEAADILTWIERFIAQYDDDYLSWFGEKDAPGSFDHGMTPDRVRESAKQLMRLCKTTLKESKDGKKRA